AWGSWLRHSRRLVGCHTCRREVGQSPMRQKIDDSRHLGRLHLLGVRWHIAASGRAIADLIDQLVASQARSDKCQVWAALTAAPFECVTIATVLILEYEGSDEFSRVTSLDDFLRNRVFAPGIHLWRPRSRDALIGQCSENRVDHDDCERGHRAATRS